ncbi:hypothetical protein [Thalassococcus sp. S3]|uniref:hypothetical protein n=1 Tax=Thalassococcus sp. S3 TaxID=2017482 RepID=UPI0010248E6B|nr:hypothetical protein [Thalassococcus sp. S3]QBF32111.1 hypothetical protein CFI11_12895 [Thalassococcus sp. S3]
MSWVVQVPEFLLDIFDHYQDLKTIDGVDQTLEHLHRKSIEREGENLGIQDMVLFRNDALRDMARRLEGLARKGQAMSREPMQVPENPSGEKFIAFLQGAKAETSSVATGGATATLPADQQPEYREFLISLYRHDHALERLLDKIRTSERDIHDRIADTRYHLARCEILEKAMDGIITMMLPDAYGFKPLALSNKVQLGKIIIQLEQLLAILGHLRARQSWYANKVRAARQLNKMWFDSAAKTGQGPDMSETDLKRLILMTE